MSSDFDTFLVQTRVSGEITLLLLCKPHRAGGAMGTLGGFKTKKSQLSKKNVFDEIHSNSLVHVCHHCGSNPRIIHSMWSVYLFISKGQRVNMTHVNSIKGNADNDNKWKCSMLTCYVLRCVHDRTVQFTLRRLSVFVTFHRSSADAPVSVALHATVVKTRLCYRGHYRCPPCPLSHRSHVCCG